MERVAGKHTYSFMDGFSGYNQLGIKLEDQHKTAFATEWGIYAFRVMPFGLTNAPATFQRLMTHAFKEYLRKFLDIYMDDLCVYSLLREQHIEHLSQVVSTTGISTDEDKIRCNATVTIQTLQK